MDFYKGCEDSLDHDCDDDDDVLRQEVEINADYMDKWQELIIGW